MKNGANKIDIANIRRLAAGGAGRGGLSAAEISRELNIAVSVVSNFMTADDEVAQATPKEAAPKEAAPKKTAAKKTAAKKTAAKKSEPKTPAQPKAPVDQFDD